MNEIAKAAEEAIAHNLADVFENGPRLSWNRKTAALAIDRDNRYVLKTGLGALGVGTMWCSYSKEDADWADLPEQDSTGQFGGPYWSAGDGMTVHSPTTYFQVSEEVVADGLLFAATFRQAMVDGLNGVNDPRPPPPPDPGPLPAWANLLEVAKAASPVLAELVELHKAIPWQVRQDGSVPLWQCEGDEACGYDYDQPDWPCETVAIIANHLHVVLDAPQR